MRFPLEKLRELALQQCEQLLGMYTQLRATQKECDRLRAELDSLRDAWLDVTGQANSWPAGPAGDRMAQDWVRKQLDTAKNLDCDSVLPMSIDDGTRITVDSIAGGPWPPAYVRLRRIHDSKGDELASYAIENRLNNEVVKAAEALLGSEFVSTSPDGSWRFIRFSDTAILELRNAVQQARAAKKPAGSPL